MSAPAVQPPPGLPPRGPPLQPLRPIGALPGRPPALAPLRGALPAGVPPGRPPQGLPPGMDAARPPAFARPPPSGVTAPPAGRPPSGLPPGSAAAVAPPGRPPSGPPPGSAGMAAPPAGRPPSGPPPGMPGRPPPNGPPPGSIAPPGRPPSGPPPGMPGRPPPNGPPPGSAGPTAPLSGRPPSGPPPGMPGRPPASLPPNVPPPGIPGRPAAGPPPRLAPGAPGAPGAPRMPPSLPGRPPIPGQPRMPPGPGVPSAPNMPPGMPSAPGMPPRMPPRMPPGMPSAAPRMPPGMPSAPSAPGMPPGMLSGRPAMPPGRGPPPPRGNLPGPPVTTGSKDIPASALPPGTAAPLRAPGPNLATPATGGIQEPPRDPNGKFTDEEILQAFQAFDLDHNNYVGAAEIRHVLINIGETPTDEEIDEMIRMVDKDGDGQVAFEEFYSMVTSGNAPPPSLVVKPSAPGTGGGDAPGGVKPVVNTAAAIQQRSTRRAALEDFAKDNNIKPETIKKAYKRFQASDKDGSGLIDYTEFCEILQIEPSPQTEKLFQLFDTNKLGQIDVREFMIGLSNFSGAEKSEKLKFAFMVFDDDGNGVITKQELMKILKANHMASSEAEVARKADTIMAQGDKDGDGVISFDEFVIVSKKFPNILFPAYTQGAEKP